LKETENLNGRDDNKTKKDRGCHRFRKIDSVSLLVIDFKKSLQGFLFCLSDHNMKVNDCKLRAIEEDLREGERERER
jgi:hypothetical protein